MSTGIGYGLLHNPQKNSLSGAEIWEIVLTTGNNPPYDQHGQHRTEHSLSEN